MKNTKKLLSLLLVIAMIFALAVPAFAEGETPSMAGKTVIVHSNDVHGAIAGYANIAALAAEYESQGAKVIVADAGDFSQGKVEVSSNKGLNAVKMMDAAGYDVATLGNHEFDYGYAQLKENLKEATFSTICCNILDENGKPAFEGSKVFDIDGLKIGFIGVNTPESQTKANPALIKGLTWLAGDDMVKAVQAEADKLKADGTDVIVVLSHLGVDSESKPNRSTDLWAGLKGVDFIIDGHSHTVMECEWVKDLSGKAVALTQTGSYFANVGEMTIKADGSIATQLVPTYDGLDSAVAGIQTEWVSAVDDMLGEKIAVAETNFYISDPATGKRRIRLGETNLGDFVADGIYSYFNEVEQLHCDLAIMNGGGIRADVDAGDWSFKTCKQVSPFGNVACLMSVTGKQIQDALEFAARFVGPDGQENGGFLHVAGATYEIHTDIPNTVQTDDKNVWIGSATGTPRVQNVKIYDKTSGTYVPLDEGKTYALAGMNYTLRNLGDGFAMFDGAELIKDYVAEDYLVMSTYAMSFGGVDGEGLPHLTTANSPLADYPGYLLNYEDAYGAGRITIL